MKIYILAILLVHSLTSFAQDFECITLNSNFKPDGGSFTVKRSEDPAEAITKIKGNDFLKGFQATGPATAIKCNDGNKICGFSLNLESIDGPWIEISSHINLGKDTRSIVRPSGFFYKIKEHVMKDLAEKEFLEAETKDQIIGHVFLFEPATGLDKAKRKIAKRIQCGHGQ